jgi:hypothetical protein
MKRIWPTSYNNQMTYPKKPKTSTKLFSKTKVKTKNFKKKKYRPKTKTMTTNQEMTKTSRWKQMTTMVKKKTIKVNVEPEESEYHPQVATLPSKRGPHRTLQFRLSADYRDDYDALQHRINWNERHTRKQLTPNLQVETRNQKVRRTRNQSRSQRNETDTRLNRIRTDWYRQDDDTRKEASDGESHFLN